MFRGLGRFTPAVGALVFSPDGSWEPLGLSQLKPGSIPGSRGVFFGVNQIGKGRVQDVQNLLFYRVRPQIGRAHV